MRFQQAQHPQREWLSQAGAQTLVDVIRRFWAARGHVVAVDVQPIPGASKSTFHIRSNLVNGLPQAASRG